MARGWQRLHLADYVVLAINPALVMAMVGSLLFFLLEILYAGAYPERMRFVLLWFVVGIVAVTRISLSDESSERTGLYVLALGCAVFGGMMRFVEYPPGASREWGWLISLFLMGIVWWTAHCLTKDCTHLDNDAEIGNEGVLSAAGMGEAGATNEEADATPDEQAPTPKKDGWLERYRRYRDKQRKKRTPGVWVVYYSLAALPLFGLGQSLIPAAAGDRRRYTFFLLCAYVASGLGLLLTTAFLGLRRYLRQRGARMPVAMTGAWLTTGLVLIALFLVVAAVLPRPLAEYSLNPLARTTSEQRQASQHSVSRDSSGKDRGQPDGDRDKNSTKDAEQTRGGQDKENSTDGKAKGGDADGKGKNGSAKGDQGNKGQGKGGKSRDGSGKDERNKDDQGGGGKSKDSQGKDGQTKKGQGPAKDRGQEAKDGSGKGSSPGQSSPPSQPGTSFQGLATFLKWLIFAVLILAILGLLVYVGVRYLSHFTAWARRLLDAWHAFWAGLFGRSRDQTDQVTDTDDAGSAPAPFEVFSDPFVDGRAKKLSPRQLTNYSFRALESWATERNLGRAEGETPLEFTGRVADEAPVFEGEVHCLGDLFTVAAYGPGPLPADCVTNLRKFWAGLAKANHEEPTRSG